MEDSWHVMCDILNKEYYNITVNFSNKHDSRVI